MCEISSLMGTLIQGAMLGPGTTVKIFETAVDTYGPDEKVPSYATAGGIEIKGFFARLKERGTIETLTDALTGGSTGGPQLLGVGFTFAASQISFKPTTRAKIVEPDGTNWQIVQTAQGDSIGDTQLSWTVPLREIL